MIKSATVFLALTAVACQVRTETIREVPGEAQEAPVVVPGSGDARPNYESGSRLVARHFAGSDGSVAFAGMWDSKRSEACSFQTTVGNLSYCLPTSAVYFYLSNGGKTFSDSACENQLVATSPLAPRPKYVFAHAESVTAEPRVHVAGNQHQGELFRLGSTGCESVGQWNAPTQAGTAWLSIGEFVSMSEFVSAEVL